jgi:hypothetical protein
MRDSVHRVLHVLHVRVSTAFGRVRLAPTGIDPEPGPMPQRQASMKTLPKLKLVAILAIALLTACAAPGLGAPGETPQPPEPTPTEEMTPFQPPNDNGEMTGEVPDQLLRQIVSDAMDRTGASEDEIEVVTAEAVTWNDGSLGCPQPGMMYTQALVDGYRVVLDADGQELNYHTDNRGHFVYCDNPQDEGLPSS